MRFSKRGGSNTSADAVVGSNKVHGIQCFRKIWAKACVFEGIHKGKYVSKSEYGHVQNVNVKAEIVGRPSDVRFKAWEANKG